MKNARPAAVADTVVAAEEEEEETGAVATAEIAAETGVATVAGVPRVIKLEFSGRRSSSLRLLWFWHERRTTD